MSTRSRVGTRARLATSDRAPAWTRALTPGPSARAALGVTLLSLALTAWWLAIDRAMPYGDAAEHLQRAFAFHDSMRIGHWGDLLADTTFYPPLTPFVGSLGIFLGGRTVAAPIVAENLVYLPLLALGCYHTAKLVYGASAGWLAVLFALGSPMIAEQFHVFMLDAPLTALVATLVWLVLAGDRFRRVDVAIAAGAVAGLGMLAKQTVPLYLAGPIVIVLLRGRGWRNWRGLVAFVLAALVVTAPWYATQTAHFGRFTGAAGRDPSVPPLARPPLLSLANLEWYFWALVNNLLLVPLLAFSTIGLVTAAVHLVRNRRARLDPADLTPELLGGALLGWVAITVIPHHDVRYTMPLIVFLAALGSGWIVRLRRPPLRIAATLALIAAIVAATLGATFGVGPPSTTALPGSRFDPLGEGVPPFNRVTVYTNYDYMVSGPREGGDILGLLKELRRDGIRHVLWSDAWAPLSYNDFNANGLLAITQIAQLPVHSGVIDLKRLDRREAMMIRAGSLDEAPPCARLSEGQGVWIRLGDPYAPGARDYCPRRDPPVYGP